MIGYYYSTHPHAKSDPWRSTTVMILLWVWNIRLEHSYFRREKWQWGATEDWRFADMRKQYQGHWWWASFFLCYISQQVQTLSSHHCCLQDFFTVHVLIFHSDHLLPIYHPSKTIYNPSTTSGGDIYLLFVECTWDANNRAQTANQTWSSSSGHDLRLHILTAMNCI